MTKFTDMNVFNHRGGKANPAFGEIATARWEADVSLSIDGDAVPLSSITYLLAYGIRQTLQDAYASATSPDEAKAMYAAKLASIFDGTVGSRGGGGGVSDETLAARTVIRRLFKTGKLAEQAAAHKAADTAKDRNAILDDVASSLADNAAFAKAVAKEVSRMADERKRVAEAAAALADLDIDV